MNLTGLHLLLTYRCNLACDHCFTWGSPHQRGTFTAEAVEDVLIQALSVESVRMIFFEGGEPFLFYPLLLTSVKRAKDLGFETGIVTNGFWASSFETAMSRVRPLAGAGLDLLQVSSDPLHGVWAGDPETHPALLAARELGVAAGPIAIEPPTDSRSPAESPAGEPITGGGVMFRGRAAEVLAENLPPRYWMTFSCCPYENFESPERVHVDPFGNIHFCQGLLIGNLFDRPLRDIVAEYEPKRHPILSALSAGGPTRLIYSYLATHPSYFVDACHACYTARLALRVRFPEHLGPDQMYGAPAG